MADVVLTDQNFTDEVEKATMPVLVDFWAPWCGPCKIVGPIVEELAKEYVGKLKVGKMDVDQNPQISGKYGIMSIPSLMFFKNGQVVKTIIGAQGKEALKKAIDEVLAA
ncbi:MAG TPA: thioredoxin [Candidatus Saccharimonadales bacterium]|nr:thioredoxin [Candidatus Saccharimonadales bacterium]